MTGWSRKDGLVAWMDGLVAWMDGLVDILLMDRWSVWLDRLVGWLINFHLACLDRFG